MKKPRIKITEIDYGSITVSARVNDEWDAFYDGSNLYISDDDGNDVELPHELENAIESRLDKVIYG